MSFPELVQTIAALVVIAGGVLACLKFFLSRYEIVFRLKRRNKD